MFSEEILSKIRDRVALVELISDYVQLKKAGKNFRGLCPFHQENSSSFFVSPEKEIFHCFGCGVGGNAFHFLMKIDSLSFPEAVRNLAERCGIILEETHTPQGPSKEKKDKDLEIQRLTAWYYHCVLKKSPPDSPIWVYLQQRQISKESVLNFHLGFCPSNGSDLHQYLMQKGISQDALRESALYQGRREFFQGRLIFPIFRQDGKVVGMGGRLIHDQDHGPKYLNSPESAIFKKSDLFYGLHLAKNIVREKKRTIVVEGYLDVITLHSQGFQEAVAPLGTALTLSHARRLKNLSEEIILMFDGDAAGFQASKKALEILLRQGRFPKWVDLHGEDPDSYLRRYGRLDFEKKLENRRNLLDDLIDKAGTGLQQENISPDQKGKVAREVLELLENIQDSVTRHLYRRRLAQSLELPEDYLSRCQVGLGNPTGTEISQISKPRWLPEEELIFEVWLRHPELRKDILGHLQPNDFLSPEAQRLAEIFWKINLTHHAEPSKRIADYLDQAPEELVQFLTGLSLKPNVTEDVESAKSSLEQVLNRLKEKSLKADLKALKGKNLYEDPQQIQEKIQALSQVMKNKEKAYGEKIR